MATNRPHRALSAGDDECGSTFNPGAVGAEGFQEPLGMDGNGPCSQLCPASVAGLHHQKPSGQALGCILVQNSTVKFILAVFEKMCCLHFHLVQDQKVMD